MAGAAQHGRDGELLAFGQAVRRRRVDAGMSVVELAKASGVSRRMIQGIEQGLRNPGLRNLFELAAALVVTASELVRDAEVDQSSD